MMIRPLDNYLLILIIILAAGLRFFQLSALPGLTFDEIFYPQFGLNYLSGDSFSSVHPPLGAYLMSVSIYLYYLMPWTDSLLSTGFELSNLDPLSYRWLVALAGTGLIYIAYKTSMELLDSQHFALLVALFFCLDGAFIVDSRIGLINIYLCFFGFLGLLFFLKGIKRGPINSSYFILAMVFFGMAISVKWNGLGFWGVAPAAVLWFWMLSTLNSHQMHHIDSSNFNFSGLTSAPYMSLFLIVPTVIYLLAWVPNSLAVEGFSYLDQHRYMAGFHVDNIEETPHPYQSAWYSWPLMLRPIAYYFSSDQLSLPSGDVQTLFTAVHLFPNPALSILSFAAVVLLSCYGLQLLYRFFKEGRPSPDLAVVSIILIGFYGNLLPWALVSRSLYLYHYQPASGFAFMALALILFKLTQRQEKFAEWIYRGSLILVMAASIYWLPLQLGIQIEAQRFYQMMWFDSWI